MLKKHKYKYGVHYMCYDDDTIENMYNMRFIGRPISFLLLDGRKTDTHCHFCASFLTLLIPGSKRVEGRVSILDGDYHSWVEVGNYVYDTSKMAMWLKDAYYERYGVLTSREVSEEEFRSEIDSFLNDEGDNDSIVAWIRDLEENMNALIYKSILSEHIERFKNEIRYDSLEVDEECVSVAGAELRNFYEEVEQFKKDNLVLVKRGK